MTSRLATCCAVLALLPAVAAAQPSSAQGRERLCFERLVATQEIEALS